MDPAAPLPTRTRTHVRQTRFEGYRRSDGLWDIEVLLTDVRDYDSLGYERGAVPAGSPVHEIRLCVTVERAGTTPHWPEDKKPEQLRNRRVSHVIQA